MTTTPDKLYTALDIQAFMQHCLDKGVEWAILSDRYGVWLSTVKHEWYEKHPDTVTEQEFRKIVENFDQTLRSYEEIYFFVRPETCHPFYQRVLTQTVLAERVRQISRLEALEC